MWVLTEKAPGESPAVPISNSALGIVVPCKQLCFQLPHGKATDSRLECLCKEGE